MKMALLFCHFNNIMQNKTMYTRYISIMILTLNKFSTYHKAVSKENRPLHLGQRTLNYIHLWPTIFQTYLNLKSKYLI